MTGKWKYALAAVKRSIQLSERQSFKKSAASVSCWKK
jgi:hypothetical protein